MFDFFFNSVRLDFLQATMEEMFSIKKAKDEKKAKEQATASAQNPNDPNPSTSTSGLNAEIPASDEIISSAPTTNAPITSDSKTSEVIEKSSTTDEY